MTIENANENNFEQNNVPSPIGNLVTKHIKELGETRERVTKRIESYPRSIGEYKELELNDRMTAAVSIFRGEMDKKDFAFNISSLSNEEHGEIDASVSYSEGRWTNALNDTSIDKLPHLNVHIVTTLNSYYTSSHLADLEVIACHEEKGYKNYTFTHNEFWVREPGFKKNHISDPKHPLFQDVVKIVDKGIETLYHDKLMKRINKLGNVALNAEAEQ